MYLQNYTFEAAYAIAQVTAQPGGPIVYVPVRLESIFGFILPAIIFLGLWGGLGGAFSQDWATKVKAAFYG